MSRSGYSDDCEQWDLIRWRGAVNASIRGKRGQAALKELLGALDAMPVKELISGELELDGSYCTLGVLCATRGITGLRFTDEEPEQSEKVADALRLAPAFIKEISFENDEGYWGSETPAHRWTRMRAWVANQIK